MDYPSKKEFVGSVKIKKINEDFSFMQLTLNKEDLIKMSQHLDKWTDSEGQERETVKVQMKKSKKGTYYAEIDLWKPTKQGSIDDNTTPDDLPF